MFPNGKKKLRCYTLIARRGFIECNCIWDQFNIALDELHEIVEFYRFKSFSGVLYLIACRQELPPDVRIGCLCRSRECISSRYTDISWPVALVLNIELMIFKGFHPDFGSNVTGCELTVGQCAFRSPHVIGLAIGTAYPHEPFFRACIQVRMIRK